MHVLYTHYVLHMYIKYIYTCIMYTHSLYTHTHTHSVCMLSFTQECKLQKGKDLVFSPL